MYFLSVIITGIILSIFTFFGAGTERIAYVIDLPSLLLLILICIPILVFSGLYKDFFSAFRMVSAPHAGTGFHEKKRALAAVSLVMKILLLTGALVTAYSLIMVMGDAARNPGISGNMLFAMICVSFISLFYALFLNLFLLLLYGKLNAILLENTEQP